MKIWIHVNGVQEGPYEFEDLPLDRITADTPVWYEGLSDWTAASKAPATCRLFHADQEPVSISATDHYDHYIEKDREKGRETEKMPASYLGWSVALTVLCCNPLGIVPIITGATTRSRYNNRDYEGAKRMSETTAWWVMVLIVTSLMVMPFAALFY